MLSPLLSFKTHLFIQREIVTFFIWLDSWCCKYGKGSTMHGSAFKDAHWYGQKKRKKYILRLSTAAGKNPYSLGGYKRPFVSWLRYLQVDFSLFSFLLCLTWKDLLVTLLISPSTCSRLGHKAVLNKYCAVDDSSFGLLRALLILWAFKGDFY